MVERTAINIAVTDYTQIVAGTKVGFNKDLSNTYYEEASNSSGAGLFLIGASNEETTDNILAAFIRDFGNDSLIFSIEKSTVDGSVMITLDGYYESSVQPFNQAAGIEVTKSTRLMNLNVKIGGNAVQKIYIGSQEVSKIYIGSQSL